MGNIYISHSPSYATSFVDHLCYLCLVFVMLSRLFIAARERADLVALVCDVYCDYVTFPLGILGQVWYSIVSTPDPCCLSYFQNVYGGS